MEITRVSGVVYRQELKLNGPKPKFTDEGRNAFETLLIKVETDAGVGWLGLVSALSLTKTYWTNCRSTDGTGAK